MARHDTTNLTIFMLQDVYDLCKHKKPLSVRCFKMSQ